MSTNTPSQTNWYSAENPLLVGLPRYAEVSDIVDKLAFAPLSGIDVNQLSFVERYSLLVGEKVPLEPTTQSVRVALTWWGMFDTGLRVRNPVNPEAKRRYWAILNAAAQGIDLPPPTPTGGIAIHVTKGPTGTGKTVTARRFCQLLGPQVIERGKNEAAGWNHLRQIVWLELSLSHDGTRGGFLTSILLQLDALLGTSYATDLPKQYKGIDKLASATIGLLVARYTGIIFIDEAQLRNLVLCGQAEVMQMFLLLLMNSGIPLAMIGNERAFDWVTYSQDKSRLYINPPEIFSPVGAIDVPTAEFDWDAIARGIMGYHLLKEPITDPERCSQILQRCSGGIARLGLTLWSATQRQQLDDGKETISPQDLLDAYEAGALGDLRTLAEGFYYRKPELLMLHPDVNAEYYAQKWGVPVHTNDQPANVGGSSAKANGKAGKMPKRHVTEQEKFKSEQTRKRKRDEKRDELSQTLSENDARQREGLIKLQLDGFDAMMSGKGT